VAVNDADELAADVREREVDGLALIDLVNVAVFVAVREGVCVTLGVAVEELELVSVELGVGVTAAVGVVLSLIDGELLGETPTGSDLVGV